jgi:ribose transport system ATP-binding protein
MREEILQFKNLKKSVAGNELFSDIELEICKGEIAGLICDNLRVQRVLEDIIRGNIRADAGTVCIDGIPYPPEKASAALRRRAFVLDGIERYSSELTVEDILMTAGWDIEEKRRNRKSLREEYRKTCKLFRMEPLDMNLKADSLPILETCRMAVLRAYLCGSELIVLLDISSFFNDNDRSRFLETVAEMERNGVGFLMIDYDQRLLTENTDRLFCIRQGTTAYILDDYTPENIDIVFHTDEIHDSEKAGTAFSDVSEPALVIRELTAGRIHDFSLTIRRGEIVCLIDSTGYICTDIVDYLKGHLIAENGSVYLNSILYRPVNYHKSVKKGICFITENPVLDGNMLFDNLTVLDNLILAFAEKKRVFTYSKYEKSLRKRCLEFFGSDIADRYVGTLKIGERQKLVYFRWMLYNPSVIVCVRPFSGANPSLYKTTEQMITMCANQGIAMLIITSVSNEASEISDRIINLG